VTVPRARCVREQVAHQTAPTLARDVVIASSVRERPRDVHGSRL
jgi:hypothetical protein